MKKAIITLEDTKKQAFLHSLEGKLLVVTPPSSEWILEGLEDCEFILTTDLKKSVRFLDFQTKVNPSATLIVLDCLRYKAHNNTIYNKIYRLTDASQNTVVIDDFPFVFDKRNIYVIMKMLGKTKHHPKQFYDDSFYIEKDGRQIRANSLEAIYSDLYEYLYCDTDMLLYETHEWRHTEVEKEELNKYIKRKVFDEKKSKIQVMTGTMGRVNRMDSKQSALKKALVSASQNPTVIYNWEKGIKDCKLRYGNSVNATSYHQNDEHDSKDVLFFETIITQRIKFYKKLKQYHAARLHFFINTQIGADKEVATMAIQSVNDLNQFYEKAWKSI